LSFVNDVTSVNDRRKKWMEPNATLIAPLKTLIASDGYPLNVAVWPASSAPRAHVVLLHGVQSHSGWYGNLGSVLALRGYSVSLPNRRGSGTNERERGHASSAGRLIKDLVEWLEVVKSENPSTPIVLGGISWGGKLAVVTAAKYPRLVDALALICPGLHPRVGVRLSDKLAIAWALLTNRYKMFPIPLSDPSLFTANPRGQAFIAADPYSLRAATAALLVSSLIIDRMVRRARGKVRQPSLLMIAGADRIVNNAKTLAYFDKMPAAKKTVIEYPDGHHTLEFEPNPSQYALDLIDWLESVLTSVESGSASDGTDETRTEASQA
jgi:acylglycerol lipase